LGSKEENNYSPERMDLEWIVIGKKAGLTLQEINEFSIQDLVAYVEIYTGSDKNKPRRATQSDIDNFYNG
jgi:hypothetical protein